MDIPYRLETIEDIGSAMHDELLTITDYRRLVNFAKQTTLHQPDALIKAKKKVTKNFIKINEDKVRDVKINFSKVANLPLVVQYPLIGGSLPWIND